MGDFDRHNSADKASDRKKAAILMLLAVVLAGVLVKHFSRRGPKSAMGSAAAAPVAQLQTSSTSPEQVLEALRLDPTEGLLLAQTAGTPLQDVPRNPFRMSEGWRASLIRPPEENSQAHTVFDPNAEVKVRVLLTVKAENYRITSIIRQGPVLVAVINGKIVRDGMTVDHARVHTIREDAVVLQHADEPEGPLTEIPYQMRLNQ